MSRADARRAAQERGGSARTAAAGRRRPAELPASVFAPRAMVAGLVTTLASTFLGALAIGVYVEVTDPTPATAGRNALDLLHMALLGAGIGLAAGVVVMLLTAWGAMLLHRRLEQGVRPTRIVAALAAAVLWALVVLVLGLWSGFGDLGGSSFLVCLPALLLALVLSWLFAPWVSRSGDRDDAASAHRP